MQVVANLANVWNTQRRRATFARVVDGSGLGPRHDHDMLLVADDGTTAGVLLGGAANRQLVACSHELLAADARASLTVVDITTDDATAAGLTCGGRINVLVQRLDSVPNELWTTLSDGRPAALATVPDSETDALVVLGDRLVFGTLGSSALDTLALSEAEALLGRAGACNERVTLGSVEVIVEAWNPAPRVLVLGDNDLATALGHQAALLGWQTTVVADRQRALDHLFSFTPGDIVIALEHDPEIAIPVIAAALRNQLGFVGALGSRRTQERRLRALAEAGVREVDLARYHGPVGLDLGGRTPAQTAVSIVAEIIAARNERTAQPLRSTTGRINR